MCGIISVGGVSYPRTSRPHSSLVEKEAGPRMTSSPRARSQAVSRREERIGDGLILNGFEEPEETDPVAVDLVVQPVADGRDPAHDPALPLGEEILGLGVFEERDSSRDRAASERPYATAGPSSRSRSWSWYGKLMNRSRSARP